MTCNSIKFSSEYIYLPISTEKVITNSAHCKKCNETLTSKVVGVFSTCKCKNITIYGGLDFIEHLWITKEHYENRTIILLKGD